MISFTDSSSRLRQLCMLSAAAFLLTSATGHANSADTRGFGAMSCAKYGEQFRKDPEETEIQVYTWANGWMSGLNALTEMLNGDSRDLNAVDEQTFDQNLNAYCDQYPLRLVWRAVEEGFLKLPVTKGNAVPTH